MKISKERVGHMSEVLITRLQEEGHLALVGEKKAAVDALDRAITQELLVEDRLNAEVRELMKAYEAEIEKGRVDYQKMFAMIKTKLAKDRGLVL
jgi:uncharacterized protein